EFIGRRQMDFACQRDVAVLGCAKLPVHFEIVHEILPTVTETDVADRSARETGAARHDQVNVLAVGADEFDTAHFRTPAGVTSAKAGDVRSQKRIESQFPT